MSCITVKLTRIETGLKVNMGQVCDVFFGYPLVAADGWLYAADGPLYVDKY